jgi:RecJ-like exonuclease
MIDGCYTLEIYCEMPECSGNMTFITDGPDCYSAARKKAKDAGWKIKRDETTICPKCQQKKGKAE